MMKRMNSSSTERLKHLIQCFHEDEEAATATEYIILLILIACFIIAVVKIYGVTVGRKFQAADEIVRKEVTIN